MSSYIFGTSVPSDSCRCCSSISHHFIQFHAVEQDNIDIILARTKNLQESNAFSGKASVRGIEMVGDVPQF